MLAFPLLSLCQQKKKEKKKKKGVALNVINFVAVSAIRGAVLGGCISWNEEHERGVSVYIRGFEPRKVQVIKTALNGWALPRAQALHYTYVQITGTHKEYVYARMHKQTCIHLTIYKHTSFTCVSVAARNKKHDDERSADPPRPSPGPKSILVHSTNLYACKSSCIW